MATNHADVLIIGAGPTGLLLAAELARHGVNLRLIEKRAEFSDKSRALAVFARTLELFDQLDFANELIRQGRRMQHARMHAGGKPIVHLEFANLDSPFPFVLSIAQTETEKVLADYAARQGVQIERCVTCTHVQAEPDSVTATLESDDGKSEQARALFLVGCDGAHSTVRKVMGFEYGRHDLHQSFIFADARLDWPIEPHGVNVFFAPEGVVAAIPLVDQGYWRVIVSMPAGITPPQDPGIDQFEQAVAHRAGLDAHLSDPRWLTAFTVRQNMATQFRIGRVLLAGDAASNHSPVGGQGMNTGLQDAHNLGWKLAAVVRGAGTETLLDSYDAERRPISTRILKATGLATRAVTIHRRSGQAIRNRIARAMTGFNSVRQRIAFGISELGVHYRSSPIVTDRMGAIGHVAASLKSISSSPRQGPIRAGDRMPDLLLKTRGTNAPGRRPARLFDLIDGIHHLALVFDGNMTDLDGLERYRPHLSCWQVTKPGSPENDTTRRPSDESGSRTLIDTDGLIHRRLGINRPTLIVIRPDGYVGLCTHWPDVQALHEYLQRIFKSH